MTRASSQTRAIGIDQPPPSLRTGSVRDAPSLPAAPCRPGDGRSRRCRSAPDCVGGDERRCRRACSSIARGLCPAGGDWAERWSVARRAPEPPPTADSRHRPATDPTADRRPFFASQLVQGHGRGELRHWLAVGQIFCFMSYAKQACFFCSVE